MSRGSFSRSVARAASSGGGKAYGSRSPVGWYLVMAVIVLVGLALVVYSRYENLHPHTAPGVGPSASQHWQAAYGIDICGTFDAPLPVNSNLAKVGIRTYGNGLIDINPSAVANPSKFEGAKATLGLFASSYPGLTLTSTSIKLPAQKQTVYFNGVDCTAPKMKGIGKLQVKAWSSPTAVGKILTGNPLAYHLTNGSMITIAFVPAGAPIPAPSSRSALISALGSSK